MNKLDSKLDYEWREPLYYHLEVADHITKATIWRASNIPGWLELEKYLADWRNSQQSNDVDIWIATTDEKVITTKTPL